MAHDPRLPDFPSSLVPNFGISDIPIIGPMSAKVGRVFDLYADSCGPSTDIWVTALWWALPKALIDITKPDLSQQITNRAGRPHKHKRKIRWKGFAQDPWNYSSSAGAPKIPINPKTFLWRFFNVQQRLGFYLMIADVGLDFTINWYSMAYTLAGCNDEIPHSWKGIAFEGQVHPDTGNFTAFLWDDIWHPINYSVGSVIHQLGLGSMKIAVCHVVRRWPASHIDADITFSARLVHDPLGFVVATAGPITIRGDGVGTCTYIFTSPAALLPGHGYRTEIKVEGDDVLLDGSYGTAAAAFIPFPFIGPDP